MKAFIWNLHLKRPQLTCILYIQSEVLSRSKPPWIGTILILDYKKRNHFSLITSKYFLDLKVRWIYATHHPHFGLAFSPSVLSLKNLMFSWGVNYKYNCLLHHNEDRIWIVTKVPLPKFWDTNFISSNFESSCEFTLNHTNILK